MDMRRIAYKKTVAREAANASDGCREGESRGCMLLTYRTRIRVVGKRRAACADAGGTPQSFSAVKNCRGVVHRGQLRRRLLAGGLSNFQHEDKPRTAVGLYDR